MKVTWRWRETTEDTVQRRLFLVFSFSCACRGVTTSSSSADGYRFPEEYTVELKKKAMKRGFWCGRKRMVVARDLSAKVRDDRVVMRIPRRRERSALKKMDETRSKPVEPNWSPDRALISRSRLDLVSERCDEAFARK